MEEKEKTLSPAALRRGYLYCIFAGAAWGFSGVCGQFLFDQRLWSVDFIIPLRMLLAGAVMLLVAAGVEGRAGFFSPFSTRRNGIDLPGFPPGPVPTPAGPQPAQAASATRHSG